MAGIAFSFKGSPNHKPDGRAKTPYDNLAPQFSDELLQYRKERDNWKIIAFGLIILVGVSVVAMMSLIAMPKKIPYVIEVAPWGEAKISAGQLTTGNIQVSDITIKYYINKYLQNIRGISTDPEVVRKHYKEAFAMSSNLMGANLEEQITKESPMTLVGTLRREVEIETILKYSENTWQVDWYEIVLSPEGVQYEKQKKRSLITIKTGSVSEETMYENPLGIYIIGLETENIKESK